MNYVTDFVSQVMDLKKRISTELSNVRSAVVCSKPDVGEDKDGHEDCCICLLEKVDIALTRKLPCRHSFHRECIERWLARYRRTCPLCRLSVDGEDAPGMEQKFTEELVIWFSSYHVPGF